MASGPRRRRERTYSDELRRDSTRKGNQKAWRRSTICYRYQSEPISLMRPNFNQLAIFDWLKIRTTPTLWNLKEVSPTGTHNSR